MVTRVLCLTVALAAAVALLSLSGRLTGYLDSTEEWTVRVYASLIAILVGFIAKYLHERCGDRT